MTNDAPLTPEQIETLKRGMRLMAEAMRKQAEAWERAVPGIMAAVKQAQQRELERPLLRRFARYRGDLDA